MKQRIIGMLGGTGSGKTAAAQWLGFHGAEVIDADEVAHSFTDVDGPVAREIGEEFGTWYLNSDGSVARRKLGRLVFASPDKLKRLEAITHPYLVREMKKRIEASDAPVVVVDCAILLNPSFRELVDEVWLVTAPDEVRIERIKQRDHLTDEEAKDRVAAQASEDEMRKVASRVIENMGSDKEFYEQLDAVLAEISD